jgi:hypothetical protein
MEPRVYWKEIFLFDWITFFVAFHIFYILITLNLSVYKAIRLFLKLLHGIDGIRVIDLIFFKSVAELLRCKYVCTITLSGYHDNNDNFITEHVRMVWHRSSDVVYRFRQSQILTCWVAELRWFWGILTTAWSHIFPGIIQRVVLTVENLVHTLLEKLLTIF